MSYKDHPSKKEARCRGRRSKYFVEIFMRGSNPLPPLQEGVIIMTPSVIINHEGIKRDWSV